MASKYLLQVRRCQSMDHVADRVHGRYLTQTDAVKLFKDVFTFTDEGTNRSVRGGSTQYPKHTVEKEV